MIQRNEKGQFIKGHEIYSNNPFIIGNKIGPRFKKGYTPWNKGLKNWNPNSKEVGKKIGDALRGKKLSDWHKDRLKKPKLGGLSKYWFGSHSEYTSIHNWVNHKLGKPTKCKKCGRDGLSGRQIHWSNISKKYKKDITDWVRLCAKCHAGLDKSRKLLLRK